MRCFLNLVALVCVFSVHVNAQFCTNCPQIISSDSFTPLTVNAGDTVCIMAGVTLTASVTLNGGRVCNYGKVIGNIVINGGTFFNGDTLTGFSSITINQGDLVNDGYVNAGAVNLQGGSSVLINESEFNCTDINLQQMVTGWVEFFNLGTGKLHCNSFSSNNSTFYNNGIFTVLAGFSSTNNSTFGNWGGFLVQGDFTNDSSYFITNCMGKVNGNWNNSGTIEGPQSGCGGFTVLGSASNSGVFGPNNSYLDMCDSVNTGSFTSNTGVLGTNVSFCACVDICSMSIGIEENQNDPHVFKIFPNPTTDYMWIKNTDNSSLIIEEIEISDMHGRIYLTRSFNGANEVQISLSVLSPGIYFLKIRSDEYITYQKILKQ